MHDIPEAPRLVDMSQKEPERLVLGTELKRMVEKYAYSIKHVSPMLHKAMVKAYQQGIRDLTNKINGD